MPPAASTSGIRDNQQPRGSVADLLRQHLKPGADLDLVTAYFTVFAYDKLRNELNQLGKSRRGEVSDAILGSSNFTTRGLGLGVTNNNVELNLVVDSNRDRAYLQAWFFDRRTEQGSEMRFYTGLLERVVDSTAGAFQERLASGLQNSRSFVLPTTDAQPKSDSEFELATWLVILAAPSV